VPEVSAVGQVEGESGPGKESGLCRRNLLGKTGSGVGGFQGQGGGGGIGSGSPWGQSNGANVYRGRVRAVALPGLVEGGVGKSGRECGTNGRFETKAGLDYCTGQVCATHEPSNPC
jgi:hypothetical protein